MLKKSLCVLLSLLMLLMMFPVNVFAGYVQQTLPINNGMETTSGITGLSSGSTSLTQDRVSGNYAVKVSVGDVPNQTSAVYTLASSSLFDVSKYSQIKLWVKPGPGAQWIQFTTNSVTVKNDKNGDGTYKVGEDLISGQWNEVTLDLTKTSSTITQAQSLTVSTNEYSTWTYDDIKTVYSPVSTVDISKMVNAQTQLTNGGVRFKSNGLGGYNTTPTVLASQNQNVPQATFSRSSVAYKSDGTQVASGLPRFENGGVIVEEGTTNILTSDQSRCISGWLTNNASADQGKTTTVLNANGEEKGTITVTSNLASWGGVRLALPQIQGQTHTFSCNLEISGLTTGSVVLRLEDYNGVTYYSDESTRITANGVYNYSVTRTFNNPTNIQYVIIRLYAVNAGTTVTFKKPQVEQKSYATSWITGGTTRSAETLTIPTKGISPTEGTWEQLVYVNNVAKTGIAGSRYPAVFTIRRASDNMNGIACYHRDNSTNWILVTYNDAGVSTATVNIPDSYTPDGWHRFGVTWNTSVAKIFIDGVLRGTINNPNLPSAFATTAYIGTNSIYSHINNPVKDVIITNKARSDSEMQSRGSTSPLPVDERTTLKMNLDGNLGIGTGDITPTIPDGKISKISIDSTYVTSAGTATNLQPQKTYLSGIQPAVLAMSGDGSKVFYANPSDGSRLYLLNLYNGENKKISDYLPTEIKVNFDGTRVAYKDASNILYQSSISYDATTGNVSTFNTWTVCSSVNDFDTQNDGTLSYVNRGDNKIYYAGTACQSIGNYSVYLDVSRVGSKIFYSMTYAANSYKLYSLVSTPAGWKSEELYNSTTEITGVWTNSDGSLVFYSTNSGIYCYQVSSKALRKLDIPAVVSYDYPNKQIVKVTDDNKLIIQLENYKYQVYDIDTDTSKDIRPSDAINPPNAQTVYFATDNSGNKMAYVANGGLATYYFNGVTRPERYLLSFDGKNSWQSYRDGTWTVVKTGSTPTTGDFSKYGMTIDDVNSLNGSDLEKLYENGRQILNFDIAVYFASTDTFITPSLNGVRVYLNTGESQNGDASIEKTLYATKQQDYTAAKWRKIKKIYPVEIFPREAEAYYFVVTDNVSRAFKDNQWVTVDSQLLSNPENNWIDITQKGMTADELKSVSIESLQQLFPFTTFSITYCVKVNDYSTEGYSSKIVIDYVENLFDSPSLTLKITLLDGTVKQYQDISDEEAENFVEWLNQRQQGSGPIFYTIKTNSPSTGITRTNDFINYYTIQSVNVEEYTG